MKSAGKISSLIWSKDGSIMTVGTYQGYFLGFLTIVPSLYSSFDTYACLMSTLTDIQVVDCARNNMICAKGALPVEPNFMNIGPYHLAMGINNQVWYFKWRVAGQDNQVQQM